MRKIFVGTLFLSLAAGSSTSAERFDILDHAVRRVLATPERHRFVSLLTSMATAMAEQSATFSEILREVAQVRDLLALP